jgi:hypothetical protein
MSSIRTSQRLPLRLGHAMDDLETTSELGFSVEFLNDGFGNALELVQIFLPLVITRQAFLFENLNR